MVVDEHEGVGSFYSLFGWRVTFAYTLAEPTKFIRTGCIPGGLVPGIPTELAMFKEFSYRWIQDGEGGHIHAICILQRFT